MAPEKWKKVSVVKLKSMIDISRHLTLRVTPVLLALCMSFVDAAVLRVNPAATGTGDGSTFANGYTHLQLALAAASSGDEIWLKSGIHTTTSATDRTVSFAVPSGVALYGGFVGTESHVFERNAVIYPTTLSGDIGTTNNSSDNSYHVITGGEGLVLDGLWITGGNADGAFPNYYGGGLYLTSGRTTRPQIRQCFFVQNHATLGGGAIYASSSDPVIDATLFQVNTCTSQGGAIYGTSSSITVSRSKFIMNTGGTGGAVFMSGFSDTLSLSKCIFYGQNTTGSGGALYLNSTKINSVNVAFIANTAVDSGGAIYAYSTTGSVVNNTFANNTASSSGSVLYNTSSTLAVDNTIIYNNTAPTTAVVNSSGTTTWRYSNVQSSGGSTAWTAAFGTDGGSNIDSNPLFVSTTNFMGGDNVFATGDDGLVLASGSPSGNTALATSAPAEDLIGRTRPLGTGVDMGAFEGVAGIDPFVQFGVSGNAFTESIGTVLVPVTLSAIQTSAVTVGYSAKSSGTAFGFGNDYTLTSGFLTIPAGSTSGNISLSITDDSIMEPAKEFFEVALSTPGGAIVGSAELYRFEIFDNDTTGSPVVFIGGDVLSGYESNTSFTVPMFLSRASSSIVTVNYAITGTATSGSDYTTATGNVTFAPGQTSKTLNLTVLNDTEIESNETMIVTLSGPTGATLGSPSVFTYTLIDNDAAPTVSFDLMQGNVTEGSSKSFTVSLSHPSDQTVTVAYSITGGTATLGTDFTGISGTLTFSAGTIAQSIFLVTLQDTTLESGETIIFTIAGPTVATLGASTTYTMTIDDNDSQPTVAFSSSTSSVREDSSYGSSVTYIYVQLSNTYHSEVQVAYTLGGTATSGSDYSDSGTGILTFSAGSTTQYMALNILDDSVQDNGETVLITLGTTTNAGLGSISTHAVTISDLNDGAARTVQFALTASNISEQNGSAYLVVYLNPAAEKLTTVAYSVTGGTATSGTDFTLASGTVEFTTASSSQYIPVAITNDALAESDETVIVSLSAAGNASLGTNSTHTVTILDSDTAPTVQFSSTATSVWEYSSRSVSLSLSRAVDLPVAVTVTGTSGTATGNVDYTEPSGNVTFSAGSTFASFTFSPINDSTVEGNETVVLTMGSFVNSSAGTNNSMTVTIIDDDSTQKDTEVITPTVTLSASSTYTENTSFFPSVFLSQAVDVPVIVNYTLTDGTATLGQDYHSSGGTLQFTPGQTSISVPLGLINDYIAEGSETFTLSISNPSNATLGSTTSRVITLTDNDLPTVGFSSISRSGAETSSGSFSVTLSARTDVPVAVTYSLGSGTATAGMDFSLHQTGILMFSAGSSSQSKSIGVFNDSTLEPSENVIYNLSNAVGAALSSSASQFTYTIIDNDSPPSFSFALATDSVSEGAGSRSVSVKLSSTFESPVSVNYSVSGGSATSGVDYTLASGTLSFSAFSTISTISVLLSDDSSTESDETLILTLSSPVGGTLGSITTTTLTIQDNDKAPTVQFDVPLRYMVENETYITLTASLSNAYGETITVPYSMAGLTATAGSDFTASSGNLTFANGSTSASLLFNVVNDSGVESEVEFAKVDLSAPNIGTLGERSSVRVGIVDDDGTVVRQRDTIATLNNTYVFGGTGSDEAQAVVCDSQNNFYVTGEFQGGVDFDPGVGIVMSTAVSGSDVFISKFSSAGQHLWTKTLNGVDSEFVEKIRIRSDMLYLVGTFGSNIDLDPGDGTALASTSGEGGGGYVVKLDSNGVFQWAKSWSGTSTAKFDELQFGSDGTLHISGDFYGTLDFDPGAGTANVTSQGQNDAFLLKLNANGEFVWVYTVGSSGGDCGHHIAVDGANNVYFGGEFSNTVQFDPSGSSAGQLTALDTQDAFVVKLTANKTFVWAAHFGSKSTQDGIGGIALGLSGEVYVALANGGTMDVDPGPAVVERYSTASLSNGLLVKLDGDKNFKWAGSFDLSQDIDLFNLEVDRNGLIYMGGYFKGGGDADPLETAFDIRRSTDNSDGFFARVGSDGALHWLKTLGGTEMDAVYGMFVKDTTIFVVGTFASTADLDPGTGIQESTSNGQGDAFILKFTQTLPETTGELRFGVTPRVSVGARTRVWARGGTRPYTLSAEPANIVSVDGMNLLGIAPGGYTLVVTDAAGKQLSHSASVLSPEVLEHFIRAPEFTGPESFEMVGLPFHVLAPARESTLALLTSRLGAMREDNFMVFGYTGAVGDGYEDLTSSRVAAGPGHGFWVASIKPLQTGLLGNSVANTDVIEVKLRQGWNMIANPYASPISSSSAYVEFSSEDVPVRSTAQRVTGKHLWSYNRSVRQYVSLNIMAAGQAAWIFVFEPRATLILTHGGITLAKSDFSTLSEIVLDANEPLPPEPPGGFSKALAGEASGGGGGCFLASPWEAE